MEEGSRRTTARLTYARARQVVIAVGLAILLLVALFTYARGVEPKEVTATILFIPIFLAIAFGKLPWGLLAGAAAALAYAALRYPDIQTVGPERFSTLILSRASAFLLFGAIGGWASRELEKSLAKLELYDQIDDETGLFNSRFFLQDTDLEMTRSARYRTIFSVAIVDIPNSALDSLSRRQRTSLMNDLGRMLRDGVRTVDRPVHAGDRRRHRLAVVLPETGPEGAQLFTDRLADWVAEYLHGRGAEMDRGQVKAIALTFPEDEQEIRRLRAEFEKVARVEFPEAAPSRRPSDS